MGDGAQEALERALFQELDRDQDGNELEEYIGITATEIRNRNNPRTHPCNPNPFPDLSDWN